MKVAVEVKMKAEYIYDLLLFHTYSKLSGFMINLMGLTVIIIGGWRLKPELEPKYQEYISHNKNRIQNFNTGDGVVSVGIHRPGFACSLAEAARGKGVIIHE